MDKICAHCKESKDVSQFGTNNAKPDKLEYMCKLCMKTYVSVKHKRNTNVDKVNQLMEDNAQLKRLNNMLINELEQLKKTLGVV